jgi:hypothetical protein
MKSVVVQSGLDQLTDEIVAKNFESVYGFLSQPSGPRSANGDNPRSETMTQFHAVSFIERDADRGRREIACRWLGEID